MSQVKIAVHYAIDTERRGYLLISHEHVAKMRRDLKYNNPPTDERLAMEGMLDALDEALIKSSDKWST